MSRLSMTRRSFVTAAAVTGAAVTLGGVSSRHAMADDSYPSVSGQENVVVKTCCRGCGKMECGVKVVVQNGRAIRVEGDEGAFQSMGNCCTKSQSSVQAAYHPDRLHYPMKRTNPKDPDGSVDPGWTRISWDEAIKLTCDAFRQAQAKFGGESIALQVGTSRIWSMANESVMKAVLQTPNNIEAWQICKGPRHFATQMVSIFAVSWMETVARPRVYVQWGGSSELSNYDDSCRTTVDVATRADVHISVDPRQANMGKEAKYWQHLHVGTDGALALAWMNVIIENELYDQLYVKKWTNAPFLYCADIDPSGFPVYKADGDTFDMKTRLLKESDVVENGSPFKFLVYDNNWESLAAQGVVHQYGPYTWFNADQNGEIDDTGGFWEGENYDSVRASSGTDSKQTNLIPGQIPGVVPDLMPFDPGIDPALYGEFEITLKDGKTHKVVPVWDLYADNASQYDLDTAERITGIPAAEIEAAAKAYAARVDPSTGYGNGGIQWMLATEHGCNAIQNCRAIDNLVAVTGNIDTPGGGRGPSIVPIDGDQLGFAAWMAGATQPSAEINAKQLGREEFSLLNWWGYWADAKCAYEAMITGDPYPVTVLFNQSGNFMNQSNTSMTWKAINSVDFVADINLWHAPCTDAADVLMPAAHWIELNSPRASQGASGGMGATVKCVEPPAEAKYDPEIIMMMCKEMGVPWNPDDPDNLWPDTDWQLADAIKLFSDQQWAYSDWHVKDGVATRERLGTPIDKLEPKYKTWNEYIAAFQKHGWWQAKEVEPKQWGTYRRYQTGGFRARDAGWGRVEGDWKPGFWTPTMKHELWSTIVETYEPTRTDWVFPTWEEPPHSPVSDPEMYEEYPMIVTTGRRNPVFFHSEHRQLPWCRELWPTPRVEINPRTAQAYGIEQGDWVWIETPYGKIRETADLYYGIDQDTINLEHTWWYPEINDNGHGFQYSAVNQLIDENAQDPMSGSSNLRGYLAKIYKATPENSPFGNPCPCDSNGVPVIQSSDDPRLKEWLPTYEGRE